MSLPARRAFLLASAAILIPALTATTAAATTTTGTGTATGTGSTPSQHRTNSHS